MFSFISADGARARAWVLAAVLLRPSAALACPVCFASASGDVLRAFYLSVAALTALPFLILGGFVIYLRRRTIASRQPVGERADGGVGSDVPLSRPVL